MSDAPTVQRIELHQIEAAAPDAQCDVTFRAASPRAVVLYEPYLLVKLDAEGNVPEELVERARELFYPVVRHRDETDASYESALSARLSMVRRALRKLLAGPQT